MEKIFYDLTNPQKSIFLTEQYYSNTNINNICGTAIISEKLNFSILEQAINLVIKNNDSFRMRFVKQENNIKQYVEDYEFVPIELVELASTDEVSSLENKLLRNLFDLEKNTYEFKIFKFPDSTGGFLLNVHHIVSDAWTLGLTCRKIMQAYENLLKNTSESIIPEQSYVHYIKTESSYWDSAKFIKDKEYWENRFSEIPNIINIPSSKNNSSASFSCEANRISFILPENKMSIISNFCTSHKISTFNFFMAILATYIYKISNTSNFVIGTPILNRTNFNEKNTTGMFINIAPFLININNDENFTDFISKISLDSMSLLRHQRYPYSEILKYIRTKDTSFPALFNILLSYQITKANNETDIPYVTRWAFNGTCADDLDIQLYDLDETKELNISYDYKTTKFTKKDITNLHNQLMNIIEQVINMDNIKLNEIELLSEKEKQDIIVGFNKSKIDYSKEKSVVELFEEQVEKTPNKIAVVFENESITYKKLNEKANQIANFLRKEHNITTNDFVSVLLNRSIDLIAAILGIVKSGATYVAIDPEYPIDRINYMLKNCNSKLVFTSEKTKKLISEFDTTKININSEFIYKYDNKNLGIITKPEDLLYVIYTSGSTGTPKGVTIKNINVNNFIIGMRQIINFSEVQAMASVATVCFDMFVFELWGTLLNGLKLVLANENEQKLPNLLNKLCIKNNVDILQTTPSRFNLLFYNNTTECFSKIKHILVGGETVPKILFDKFKEYENIEIHHMYGPTETTVWSTQKTITDTDKITIGVPIANTQVYILDENKKICPIGVAGEIYISGDGVGNGYLYNNALNSKSFIPNPFIPGTTMYKTGDLGMFTNNGEIIYLNRIDNQVKIRGYRVELDEIEKIIFNFSNIRNCVVIKKTLNSSHEVLCAYYTEKNPVNLDEIKKELQAKLPNYMVPQYFVKLDDFPYTQNGKIDKKALPLPKAQTKKSNSTQVRNENDAKLIDIISTLLELENVGLSDNLFELGMDSLIAINLSVKILNEFNIQLNMADIFNNPIIKDLSDFIATMNNSNTKPTITKAEKQDSYPLSSAEQRIYYASLVDGDDSILYNVSGGIIFDKMPNINFLNDCIIKLLNRHEAFKTYFTFENNNLVQKISETINFSLIREKSNSNNIDNLFKEFIKPFNLSDSPLFRAKLVELKNKKVLLMMDTHHIICDGSSLNIFIKDLCALYNSSDLQENLITYTDYILWEKSHIKTNNFKNSEKFWIEQFEDDIPILNLPTTYPRPANKTYNGKSITKKISSDDFKKIREISKRYNLTPNIILLCAYYILLYKYTNQNDIIIGTPVAGRTLPELNNIIGMFVNTLPLRKKFNPNDSIQKFLEQLKEHCANAFSHQDYSFDTLVSKINAPRDNSRNFLFDVLFTYQTNRYSSINLKDLKSEFYIPKTQTSKFDISLEVLPLENEYLLTFEYCTSLFDKKYIDNFSEHYINSIKNILNNIDEKISNVSILSEDEENQLLHTFNKTNMKYDETKTLSKLFEEQVEKTPDNIAIVFENNTITYSELNKKSNQIAWYLRKIGLTENCIIGIMLPRSLEVLICMLGALKAGICYIPIDPALPESRIEYMLKNSNSSTLLTFNSLINKFDLSKLNVENIINVNLNTSPIYSKENCENLNLNINPESASYAIYTSGSTGKPKGVLLNQKALANLTIYLNKNVKFLKNEYSNTAIVSITTISFDIFIFETLISLQRGLKIIMANESEQNTPTLLDELIYKHKVKCIQTTPSRMALFMKNKNIMPHLKQLKYIVLAGEALPKDLQTALLKLGNVTIYNGYGPSETTVFSTFTDVTNYKEITIGKPLANTQIYVLDKDLKPVPIDKPGEIYIAGDGVAIEYINNKTITKERFIKNPFIENTLMYKTGDLAKYLPNGELSYIGRVDNQVKIRGLRIELDEIEKCILKYNHIEKCIISVKTDSHDRQYIIAYLIVNDRISVHKLRNFLKDLLPKYMIPTYFTILDELPYLPNGKINKNALPEPDLQKQTSSQKYVAPKTNLELKLVNIFQNLLSISPIGIKDNFFELGGDSLLAINLQIELSKITSSITYSDIFLNPTVSDLATKIKENKKHSVENIDFDEFTKYEKILNHNNILPKKEELSKINIGNILLTGSTGFLGSHILDEFLQKEDGIAYCLIRPESGLTSKEKLLKKLHYYFGNKYDDLIDKRIIIEDGDISQINLGMPSEKLKKLFNNISCVINSAAKVSHYGKYELFKKINVDGVENILYLCKKYNKKVYHISTISVSGADSNSQSPENTSTFFENNLYINQNLDNVYIRSKFEAEKTVLNYILDGLDAYIIRVGNLMHRSTDTKFQPNIDENAFVTRLTSFIELGIIPKYLLNEYLEFTPVDCCADAILKFITHPNTNNRILHLFNQNHVTIREFSKVLKQYKEFNFVNDDEFLNTIDTLIQKHNSHKVISGIIKDFDTNRKIIYRSNITAKNDFSNAYLDMLNFKWPKIDNTYLNNFIKYILKLK